MALRHLDSGLILSEQSQDGATIEKQLKRKDPQLALQGWPSVAHGCIIWKVVREYTDHPPETVCVWQSDRGEPYPLSSGILEMVDRHDRNGRTDYKTEDQLNRELGEREQHQLESDLEALKQDWLSTEGKSPAFHRGIHLRRNREMR